ncbi:hypothetical protein ACA910_011736 [Epithemia clementina (nom. ined.)]
MNQFNLLPDLPDKYRLALASASQKIPTLPTDPAKPPPPAKRPKSATNPKPSSTPSPTSANPTQRTQGRNGALVLKATVDQEWKKALDTSN